MNTLSRLLSIAALAAAAATPALADTRMLDGKQLVATLNLDDATTIEPDPTLNGQVRLSADDLSCVQASGGTTATISTGGCGDALGHLRIEVPVGSAVTLVQNGDGTISVGSTSGPVTANIAGSGNLTVGRVGALVMNVNGSGDSTVQAVAGSMAIESNGSGSVRVGDLAGNLHTHQRGSGDLVVGTIHAGGADIVIESSGDLVLGKGEIANLHARISGSGDLTVAATAGNADLVASGGGDIRVARVSGNVRKSASGNSSISVMNSDLAGFGLGKLAQIAVDTDDDHNTTVTDGDQQITVRHSHGGSSSFHDFLAGLAVLVILYAIWRTVQSNGGVAGLRSRFQSSGHPAQPTHPGVLAVRDSIGRLEQRLARVEGYVTTREFDLQRKFRELDANK